MRYFFLVLLLLFSASYASAQNNTFTNGDLEVEVFVSNPCDGLNNGYITFTVLAADGPSADLLFIFGPVILGTTQTIAVGDSFTFDNSGAGLPSGNYRFALQDASNQIDELGVGSGVFLVKLSPITINVDSKSDNNSCISPNGQIDFSISGGSRDLGAGNGLFDVVVTSSTGYSNTLTVDGESLVSLSGLSGGSYTINVDDSYSSCSGASSGIELTDPSSNIYNITTLSPLEVCIGDDVTIDLDGSETPPAPETVEYTVNVNGSPVASSTVTGTGGAISLTIPSGSFSDGDVLTVQAQNNNCPIVEMNGSVTVDVVDLVITPVVDNNERCLLPYDGSIQVTVTGGVGPYSYAWSGPNGFASTDQNISVLEPGAYQLEVTDNGSGCIETTTIEVIDDAVDPTINSVVENNTNCVTPYNGEINLTVTAGSGDYSYSWTGPGT
ncbi:SprB repeat-containing protein, partial [Fulvivirga sediminis]